MERVDFLIVGAGIAGASAAYELSRDADVVVVEREDQPGYHSTGRSAAMFLEGYGNRVIRAITSAGRAFLESPPDGFAETPILSPRGALFVARADQEAAVETLLAEARETGAPLEPLSPAAAIDLVPALRPDYVAHAVLEPDGMDIDVHALHQGFLRGLKARGGRLVTDAEVLALVREGEVWRVETRAGDWAAPVVVNAAGAWADALARLAGARPVGLQPRRRTAFTFAPPADMAVDDWPLVADIDEEFYFKPDAGQILGSPADETPVPPQDVQPEDLDVAVAVDRIQKAARLEIPRIARKWAGLRSFVADKSPVAGFAPDAPGFFWLAGQGGYGIQTSPGMGRIAAALARGRPLPEDIAARGVAPADLAPERLWR